MENEIIDDCRDKEYEQWAQSNSIIPSTKEKNKKEADDKELIESWENMKIDYEQRDRETPWKEQLKALQPSYEEMIDRCKNYESLIVTYCQYNPEAEEWFQITIKRQGNNEKEPTE